MVKEAILAHLGKDDQLMIESGMRKGSFEGQGTAKKEKNEI